jgi:Fe-S-cluster containining protein
MNDEPLTSILDWTLSRPAFRNLVRELIHEAEKRGKVLPLPMDIMPGQPFLDQLTVLLARIDCSDCPAPCCRANPNNELTRVMPTEYELLAAKYGKENFIVKDGNAFLPSPCPFLRSRHGELCAIHPDRPLVCAIFPFQPGAEGISSQPMLALASSCPAAKKLARDIYMTAWDLRHFFNRMKEPDFLKVMEGDI